MWIIFKVYWILYSIASVVYVLVLWPWCMWDPTTPPALEGEVLTTALPGKSPNNYSWEKICSTFWVFLNNGSRFAFWFCVKAVWARTKKNATGFIFTISSYLFFFFFFMAWLQRRTSWKITSSMPLLFAFISSTILFIDWFFSRLESELMLFTC